MSSFVQNGGWTLWLNSLRPLRQSGLLIPAVLAMLGHSVPTVAGPIPDAPNVVLASPSDSRTYVSWPPSPRATTYNIKRSSTSNGPFVAIATNVKDTTFEDNTVVNDQTYYYVVSALNEAGESTNSTALSVQPSAAILDVLPGGAKVEILASNFSWLEGPLWVPKDGGSLIFSDLRTDRMYRWWPGLGTNVFRAGNGIANGNALDPQGRLLTCEHNNRRISRTEPDGTIVPFVDQYQGKGFNSPNDLVLKSDGTVWFTDPSYGLGQTQAGRYVYRCDSNGGNESVTPVGTDFDQPNGLCFSPDEKLLYVSDSGGGRHHIRVFTVTPDNTLIDSKIFAVISPGFPDGIRCDSKGRIYTSCGEGVQIFDPNGMMIGKILTSEPTANLCFGASDDQLFIAGRSLLFGITRLPDLIVTGIRTVPIDPLPGQKVDLLAVVKNKGTGATPAGTKLRVGFTVGSETNVVWSDGYSDPVPPDGSVVLRANNGISSRTWTATTGTKQIRATADDLNRIEETAEGNNAFSISLTVPVSPTDSDGDGVSNSNEVLMGTDPSSAASVLRVISSQFVAPDTQVITWASVMGKSYSVLSKGSFDELEWGQASPVITASEAQTSWTNQIVVAGPSYIYRILWVP